LIGGFHFREAVQAANVVEKNPVIRVKQSTPHQDSVPDPRRFDMDGTGSATSLLWISDLDPTLFFSVFSGFQQKWSFLLLT
jgi:hypothetical protein